MKEQAWDLSDKWIEKLGRYWVHVLALFADLAAIVGIGASFLADHGRNLVTLYVLALFTTLWILLVIQEYRYARKASYAEAGRYLHTMLHFLLPVVSYCGGGRHGELVRGRRKRMPSPLTPHIFLIPSGESATW